jgi:hypothetical protein
VDQVMLLLCGLSSVVATGALGAWLSFRLTRFRLPLWFIDAVAFGPPVLAAVETLVLIFN